MDFATLGLLLVTIVGWGLWGFFQKVGVSEIGVESCLLLNYSTVFLMAISYLALIQKLHIPRSGSVIYPILGGISVTIGSIAFFTVIEKIPIGIARSIAGLAVLITALLGVLLLGETLSIKHHIGIVLAVAAMILLSS